MADLCTTLPVAHSKPLSHRERDENYSHIVAQPSKGWRIIVCKHGLQRIIQKKEASNRGPWHSEKFITSRDALIEACESQDLLCDPNTKAVLHALPDYVNQLTKKLPKARRPRATVD